MDFKNNRVFRFKYWRVIGLLVTLITVATLINLYGIYILGSLENWRAWRAESYEYLLAWRLAVYALLIWAWLAVRPRVLNPAPQMKRRIQRAEFAAAMTCTLFEITRANAHGLWGAA
ncbi:hypothetical protein [Pseudomonas quasicaspiana]|uniref:hypothetical protein n=1 Tax=Pseudomonas quasicaspiana TaxID=2829821 RepID=UPI001E2EC2E6|nr:hypothetical protein [Pseudomonas quasicaspiana]MCD5976785.1 hypothetical protein [Pseudomonas quasicaspiana]